MSDAPEEMAPCPFCGNDIVSVYLDDDGCYFVVCHECGGSGGYEPDRGEAIKTWNRRALNRETTNE